MTRRGCKIDIHELNKKNIGYEGESSKYFSSGSSQQYRGGNNTNTTSSNNNSGGDSSLFRQIGFVDTRVYFDSEFKEGTSDLLNGELKFTISPLNNQQPISNVVSITISSFNFPNIPNPNQSSGVDYNFDHIVFISIPEFPSTDGYKGPQNTSYYFRLNLTNENAVAVKLIPENPTYTFNSPIPSVNSITLKFRKPQRFQNINIPPDVVNVVSLNTNPARFTILTPYDTTILGNVGLLTGSDRVAVSFRLFNSNDATANIATTDRQGLLITNIIDANTFEIATLDHSGVVAPVTTEMYIKKNKIAIEATFTTLVDTPTNYLINVKK